MTESELYAGIATTLLDKFAGRIIKGLTDPVKKAWEQFKIDFDIVFRDYLKNSVEKYGKIKTILYRTEPKPLNEFFECPNLRKGRSTIVSGESIDDLLDISHFLIIEGTGGIGKSTFDNYAEIPEKLHLFYANAFETLYSKHDATKSGFRRELKCGLSYDAFKKTFAQFCFITYYQGKIELTHDEVVTILGKIGARMVGFNPQNYIFDLVNSICVLYKDGLNYKFTHRSFQEYFAAIFLKELPDQDMGKIGTSLVKKDYYQSAHDSVFPMLYDMAEQRFEQNILLPFVIEFETVCEKADKYDFYYEKIEPVIEFDYAYSENSEDNPRLFLYGYFDKDPVSFIYSMANHYRNRSQVCLERSAKAEKRLLDLLTNKFGKSLGERVEMSSLDDKEVYSLFKSTWIGEQLNTMAKLRETLEHRRRRETQDLFGFLDG